MTKKTLQAMAAAVLFTGAAYAEDGGDGGQAEALVYTAAEAFEQSMPLGCEEARGSAWFERELERTDGEVDPAVKQAACRPEYLAEVSTADAD